MTAAKTQGNIFKNPRNMYTHITSKSYPQIAFFAKGKQKTNETVNVDISGYFHENNSIFVSVQFLHLQLLMYW